MSFLRQLRDEINETCYSPIFARPKNARLIWVKEDGELQSDNGTIIRDLSKHDDLLILDSLTLDDTGTYACYDRGFKVRTFKLLVLGKSITPLSQFARSFNEGLFTRISIQELRFGNGQFFVWRDHFSL